MAETIEVGMRKVESVPFNGSYGTYLHSFIVYTNSDGQKYIFSAFPEPMPGDAPSTVDYTKDGDAQRDLKAQYVRYSPLSFDAPYVVSTAEINTGKRRILEYLFAPIVEVGTSALRER